MRKVFAFQKPHLDALRKNQFFTCPSDDKALYWAYGENVYREIPSLVTSDNVLQIYHVFFESSLRSVEAQSLEPELRALTGAMLRQANRRLSAVKGTALEAAAAKNVAYFAVASDLLEMKEEVAEAARPLVEKEMARIKAASGFQRSAIFPYDLDYSQFIVRGHYTRTPVLGRYFKAMMWYGLAPFAVATRTGGRVVPATEQIQQALLICRDLEDSGAEVRWRKVYDVTSLFAGKANHLTPAGWREEAGKVFGAKPSVADYGDRGKIARFAANLAALPPPEIVARKKQGTNPAPVQFRFMGQRAIPDSLILQRLSEPDLRPFPNPLDVFAVMGNGTAQSILDGNPKKYNPKGWTDYLRERARLEREFAALPRSSWSENLYWSWLDSLRVAVSPAPANYPAFMRGEAWAKKSLYSALASWAELRHDTILYGLQSVAEMGDGEVERVKGYVEPNVRLYRRMDALTRQTQKGLKDRGYLSKEIDEDFREFLGLVTFFIRVSEKELAGQKLTAKEHERIHLIEGELEAAHNDIQKTANGYEQLSEDDLDIALVADVHTALGRALTVGVGRADHVFAVVPVDGKRVLARGTALSYYEFLVPVSERMTDAQWKKRLNEGRAPARPDWIKPFFVPTAPKLRAP